MRARTRCIVVLLFATVILGGPRRSLAGGSQPFTVKDSIEMATFSDPYTRLSDSACKRAPDGRHFLVVTTRGILRTNQLVSTLWVYSAADVETYLNEHGDHAPKPVLLYRIAGVPKAQQNNSYGSLITRARWSSDSQSVLSLVEQPDGHRHLIRSSLSGQISIDLTPGIIDIKDFCEAAGTIAYLVVEHTRPPRVIGEPINSSSSDLTGLSLFHILFPKKFPDPSSFEPAIDLWVRHRGMSRQVNIGTWHYPASAAGLGIAVSPDGKALIAARPVPSIPTEWSKYRTVSAEFGFSQAHTGTDRSGKSSNWPWQYIYVDLDKMKSWPLVDAPSGFLAGYGDTLGAVWSPDSQAVLFTNTYLPLPDSMAAQFVDEVSACAAAIYSVARKSSNCVAYARNSKQNEILRSAVFGVSSDDIVLDWLDEGSNQIEVYGKTQQGWALEPGNTAAEEPQTDLKISIRQDIDERPTLWASEQKEHLAKELWDPNPQLKSLNLGQASVYTWIDSTGYKWHGGLVLPPNFVQGHRYPLVIQTHGFFNDHEFLVDGSFTTGFAARAFAAAGIIVLQMEDRADRHVRPPYEEALLATEGFESAIDHLNGDGLIDPSLVGIIGFSRAAWYVEEALIRAPNRFRAATLIDGIDQSYMTYMLFAPGNPEATVEQEDANGGKPFGAGLEHWVKNASGFNLYRVHAPVRIECLGMISVLGEWEIYSSLAQQGKPVDLVYIPNGQHILQRPQERYASQQGDVDWFRFWLQGYVDPSPMKAAQYRRWNRLLRDDYRFAVDGMTRQDIP